MCTSIHRHRLVLLFPLNSQVLQYALWRNQSLEWREFYLHSIQQRPLWPQIFTSIQLARKMYKSICNHELKNIHNLGMCKALHVYHHCKDSTYASLLKKRENGSDLCPITKLGCVQHGSGPCLEPFLLRVNCKLCKPLSACFLYAANCPTPCLGVFWLCKL
jgi:hypothetical protein